MLGLTITNIEVSAETNGGIFSASIPLKSGLNVIRANNSSGKSTCVNAIAYGLGLEAILGPSRKRPFPKSLYDVIFASKDDTTPYFVGSSKVTIVAKNSKGIEAKILRDIKGDDNKVVVDISGVNKDYFLGSAGEIGSAKSERGFHYWLANFIGWDLPNVVTFEGKELKLYLECIFPLFFIEQKRGWSEIQANSPSHYGIRNVKKAAAEFCLGIDSFEQDKKIALLKNTIDLAEREWVRLDAAAESVADFNSLRLNKLPALTRDEPEHYIEFFYLENDVYISMQASEKALQRSIEYLTQNIASNAPNDERLDALLSSIRHTRSSAEENSNLIELTLMSISNANEKLSRLKDDYDQYLQLKRLRSVGSTVGVDIKTDKCPICQSDLPDTLGNKLAKRIPMTLDENIEFLKTQIDFFEAIKGKGITELQELRAVSKLIKSSLESKNDELDRLKEDLADINGAANGVVRQKILAELKLKETIKLKDSQFQLNEQAARVRSNWLTATDSLRLLRKETDSEKRYPAIKNLESMMKEYLIAFGFPELAMNEITISQQTLRPEQQGYDIVAESSASDYIRVIWSYTLALLMLAGKNENAKHGGFVVFDEPRQHEASKVSFASLINKAADSFLFGGQVIFATSLEEAELRTACDGKEVNLICFDNYILKRAAP